MADNTSLRREREFVYLAATAGLGLGTDEFCTMCLSASVLTKSSDAHHRTNRLFADHRF